MHNGTSKGGNGETIISRNNSGKLPESDAKILIHTSMVLNKLQVEFIYRELHLDMPQSN